MSNYRDDNQDTAIASSKTFGGLSAVIEELLRVSDALLFGIAITLSSQAIASDEVIDNSIQVLHDSALITDSMTDAKHASQTHLDSAKISDSLRYNLMTMQPDSAAINDELLVGTVTALSIDSAQASDSTTSHRIVSHLITDSAHAKDSITAIERDLIIDSLSITDSATDKLQAVQLINDSAGVTDSAIGSIATIITDSAFAYGQPFTQRNIVSFATDRTPITDKLLFNRADIIIDDVVVSDTTTGKFGAAGTLINTAVISDTVLDSIIQNAIIMDSIAITDEVIDKLDTIVLIVDGAVIEDSVLSSGGAQGQAWTANVDSWAMSRYNPYNYNRLVVINGVLYGEADDGIYRLDQEVDAVTAIVKTGKMDLGRGQLTHPASAYLEYELNGGASMTVHSTQKGIEQQYTYMLPSEVAGELTNGRFIFGRGLRGRHFAFELIMIGTHGHINDLSIEHMPTSRRV